MRLFVGLVSLLVVFTATSAGSAVAAQPATAPQAIGAATEPPIILPVLGDIALTVDSRNAGDALAFGMSSPEHRLMCKTCTPGMQRDFGVFDVGSTLVFYMRDRTHGTTYLSTDPNHARVRAVSPVKWTIHWDDAGGDGDFNDLVTSIVLSGSQGGGATSSSRVAPERNRICYTQMDADNGVSIVSQNFEAAFDAYDTRGADDFTLTRDCVVRRIDVAGAYLNGFGPAASENVTIYRNNGGLPGSVISNQTDLPGIDDGTGNLRIALSNPVPLLAQHTYIVSVQVNMDFSTGGEWGWSTNNTQRGYPASWRNNQDGFGTGCAHFTPLLTCMPSTEGADFAFDLANNR